MLVTVLTIAELAYLVGLATWILLEKRSPVATLAWILSLIALPYIGFLVFFFLGPRRIVRKRMRHKRARGAHTLARAADTERLSERKLEPRIAELVQLGTKTGEPPADLVEDVRIFHDAASTYDAIVEAIASAKHHVHVGYYIFDPDDVGTRIRDALIERAKAGVTVRVLVDDVGSSRLKRAFLRPMRDAGVFFARFNPVTFSRIRSRFDFRNHRKIVVCDGVVGFTGGINFTDDYVSEGSALGGSGLGASRAKKEGAQTPWRDTHMRVAGDAVRWLQLTFLDDWNYATGYTAREQEYFPPPTHRGKKLVQVVASGPDRDFEPIQKMYFAAITSAHRTVYVTTPYFVPDEAILTALTTAALRGVDVRVLLPKWSDSFIVTAAARSYYDAALAAGVRIFEYQPTMIHAKTLVVDDYFAAIGTANLDNRSFRLNFEITAVVYDAEEAAELREQFIRDLRDAEEIRAKDRKGISFGWRFAEAGARVLSPLL